MPSQGTNAVRDSENKYGEAYPGNTPSQGQQILWEIQKFSMVKYTLGNILLSVISPVRVNKCWERFRRLIW